MKAGRRNVFKRFGLKDSKVVDQNVELRIFRDRQLGALRGTEIDCQAFKPSLGTGLLQPGEGFVDSSLRPLTTTVAPSFASDSAIA